MALKWLLLLLVPCRSALRASVVIAKEGVDQEQSRSRAMCQASSMCVAETRSFWTLVRAHLEGRVFVDVGATRGLVSALMLHNWAPQCNVSLTSELFEIAAYYESNGRQQALDPCHMDIVKGRKKGLLMDRTNDLPRRAFSSSLANGEGRSRDADKCAESGIVVHSFEANPSHFEMATELRSSMNASWIWHPEHVSNFDGTDARRNVWDATAPLVSNQQGAGLFYREHQQIEKLEPEVSVTTLDAWAERDLHRQKIAVLKIDAKGHEGNVLVGASRLLTDQQVDLLLFGRPQTYPLAFFLRDAVHTKNITAFVKSERDLFDYFLDIGYTCYLPGHKHSFLLLSHSAHTIRALRQNPSCDQLKVACVLTGSQLDRAFLENSVAYALFVESQLATSKGRVELPKYP